MGSRNLGYWLLDLTLGMDFAIGTEREIWNQRAQAR